MLKDCPRRKTQSAAKSWNCGRGRLDKWYFFGINATHGEDGPAFALHCRRTQGPAGNRRCRRCRIARPQQLELRHTSLWLGAYPLSAAPKGTEAVDSRFVGLDTWEDAAILSALLEGQQRALQCVEAAIPALGAAAQLAASSLAGDGRLIYLAAGSPALIALGDALEIPQTFGVPRNRIVLLFAGGHAITHDLTGVDEDNAEQAQGDIAAAKVNSSDCVVAISASGSTPYTVAGLKAARSAGAATIGIAGNADAPLLAAAEVQVFLDAGAEVIAGSTRLGAGTAQKAALNMLSTLIGVRLGHIHDGLMVNVRADNEKLRGRAVRIITSITGVAADTASQALLDSGGEVKPAVLIAAGAGGLAEANRLLDQCDGNLRRALRKIGAETPVLK
jgi:N-acetylmuramic acid 6-phosphate etherase